MGNFNIRFGRANRTTTSVPNNKRPPIWGIILVGVMFIGMGSVFLYMLFINPLMRSIEAGQWIATPCIVTHSEVQTHPGDSDSGPTYSIEVSYRYTVSGKSFVSDQYDFLDYSSSGYNSKQQVVNQLPPGKQTTCYVNPADPAQAVMVRDLGGRLWLGLIPSVFIIAGVAVVIAMIRGRRKTLSQTIMSTTKSTNYLPAFELGAPSIELRRGKARLFGVIFVGIFAAFWNGFVWFALVQMLGNSGRSDTVGLLFLIPFLLVGLGMIGAFGYFLLQFFNPRIQLTMLPSVLRPGMAFDLRWNFPSGSSKIQRLMITLEGNESSTYRQGTNSRTDTSTFMIIPLLETTSPAEIAAGQSESTLPIPLMHSAKLGNNAITWQIKVRGEIPKWPDIKDDYDVVVLPANWPTR